MNKQNFIKPQKLKCTGTALITAASRRRNPMQQKTIFAWAALQWPSTGKQCVQTEMITWNGHFAPALLKLLWILNASLLVVDFGIDFFSVMQV